VLAPFFITMALSILQPPPEPHVIVASGTLPTPRNNGHRSLSYAVPATAPEGWRLVLGNELVEPGDLIFCLYMGRWFPNELLSQPPACMARDTNTAVARRMTTAH
jgi:hypothetical protein